MAGGVVGPQGAGGWHRAWVVPGHCCVADIDRVRWLAPARSIHCYIGGSNLISGPLPRSWGSRSYEVGIVEHGTIRWRCSSGSYEVGQVEHGDRRGPDVAVNGQNAGGVSGAVRAGPKP